MADHRPPAPVRAFLALSLALLHGPALADVVYLKNGASIAADSWEERGDDLLIRQGGRRISVPRSEVARIEIAAPPAAAAPPREERPAAAVRAAPPAPASSLGDDEILRAIDDLKRRINDFPLARAENTRRLVALLNLLGSRALRARDDDAALARFREALGYDPKDSRAQLGLALSYVHKDQDIFARSTLERALLDHPEDADLHALLGDVYHGQERIDEALREWQKANELKPGEALKSKIDKLVRERSIDGGYRQSEAAHFTLKYDGERAGPDLGGQILDFLEGEFRTLETRFDHYPVQPIVVILYPQRQFYEATQADANVAGLYDGKIRVPIGGLKQLNAEARRVLLHELAHAFIAGKSRGSAPRWLHEGLAQMIEGKTTTAAGGSALAKQYQALQDKPEWGRDFTYPSALSFVEYLDGRLGFPALVDVLEAMSRGTAPDAAFEEISRYTLAELRQAWGESLIRKHLQ